MWQSVLLISETANTCYYALLPRTFLHPRKALSLTVKNSLKKKTNQCENWTVFPRQSQVQEFSCLERWFQKCLSGQGQPYTSDNIYHLLSHHSVFIFIIVPFVLEHWTSSPVLVSGPNTKSLQWAQLLLLPLYFSVRSLPVMAFCKSIRSLACTKKVWKATILLHHSFYHKLNPLQISEPCYTHCALMGHGFTRCPPTGDSWSSAWLHGSPWTLLALLCHSPWSWHSCQPWYLFTAMYLFRDEPAERGTWAKTETCCKWTCISVFPEKKTQKA